MVLPADDWEEFALSGVDEEDRKEENSGGPSEALKPVKDRDIPNESLVVAMNAETIEVLLDCKVENVREEFAVVGFVEKLVNGLTECKVWDAREEFPVTDIEERLVNGLTDWRGKDVIFAMLLRMPLGNGEAVQTISLIRCNGEFCHQGTSILSCCYWKGLRTCWVVTQGCYRVSKVSTGGQFAYGIEV